MVLARASDLTRSGIYAYLGESGADVCRELLFEFLGGEVATLFRDSRLLAYEENADLGLNALLEDWRAFDNLRRRAEAGSNFTEVVAEVLSARVDEQGLSVFQDGFAKRYASQGHFMMASVASDSQVFFQVSNNDGQILGQLAPGETLAREIPFGEYVRLSSAPGEVRDLIVVAALDDTRHLLRLRAQETGSVEFALTLPLSDGGGQCSVLWSDLTLISGAQATVSWSAHETCPLSLDLSVSVEGQPGETITAAVQPLEDPGPTLSKVRQWAIGDRPETPFDFQQGDPLGRLVLILMSEEVIPDLNTRHFQVAGNNVVETVWQADERLAFLLLERPVGPFVERSLNSFSLQDYAGQTTGAQTSGIATHPEMGDGARVMGTVMDVTGQPVPFATIDLKETVWCPGCEYGAGGYLDQLVATYMADVLGHFEIDYALRNDWSHFGESDFRLEAEASFGTESGTAATDILYNGQIIHLNIVLRGYGNIAGQLRDVSGQPIAQGEASAQAVEMTALHLSTGRSYDVSLASDGTFEIRAEVGNVLLRATRTTADGVEIGINTVFIPNAESVTEQDIFLVPMQEHASVNGRVLEADAETGAARVRVIINADVLTGVYASGGTMARRTVASGYTDEQGYFGFVGVPTGNIEVYSYRQSTWEDVSANTTLSGGEETSLTLVYPGSGGVVSGFVVDASGAYVAGARVISGPSEVVTDSLGRFEIVSMPFRTLRVQAQDVDSRASAETMVTLSAWAPHAEILLTLEPVGSIRGSVLLSDGATPVPGQEVQLWADSYQGGGGVLAISFSDLQGAFEFIDVPVDSYELRAVTGNHGDGGSNRTEVRFANDSRENVEIVFRGLGTVRGRVMQDLNGTTTPIKAPVAITRDIWRVVPRNGEPTQSNYYLDYVTQLAEMDGVDADAIRSAWSDANAGQVNGYFILATETVEIESELNVDLTNNPGGFEYTGPVLSGPVIVRAGNLFTDQAVAYGTVTPGAPDLDVGDLIVHATTGAIAGRILMPDGVSLLEKESAAVTLHTRNSTGSVNAVAGEFQIAIVPSGAFTLEVDTGVVSCSVGDDCAMPTRLFGRANGWMPGGGDLPIVTPARFN